MPPPEAKAGTSTPDQGISAAAAAGAAAGVAAAESHHLGITEQQMKEIVTTTLGMTLQGLTPIAQAAATEAVKRQAIADKWKRHGTTAAISATVFVAGTMAMAGYERYRTRDNGDGNRGQRNEA